MFVAEAQISAKLVHPNIVSVLDFDRDDEQRMFLVMELVEGCDLDALAATGHLPFPVVIQAIVEALRGLAFAHEQRVIHRDVSPHNVLVSWEGAVKISDFGIAKVRDSSKATASLFIKGKPSYMSPEQASGKALDGRSDLFAIGAMMWELLVGKRLFLREDTRTTLSAVLFDPIARPRSLRPEVPKDLERVAMKLLERDLSARYADANAAIEALLACADAANSGREALATILVERFQNAPAKKPVHARTTIPAPGGSPPHSLGAGRAAMTVAARRTNVALRVAILTAIALGLGLAAYAIVSSASCTGSKKGATIAPIGQP
jgi:serine/threonine protein kinase